MRGVGRYHIQGGINTIIDGNFPKTFYGTRQQEVPVTNEKLKLGEQRRKYVIIYVWVLLLLIAVFIFMSMHCIIHLHVVFFYHL